jgi:hypothetical protein
MNPRDEIPNKIRQGKAVWMDDPDLINRPDGPVSINSIEFWGDGKEMMVASLFTGESQEWVLERLHFALKKANSNAIQKQWGESLSRKYC